MGIVVDNRFDCVHAITIDGHGHVPIARNNPWQLYENPVGIRCDRHLRRSGRTRQGNLHASDVAVCGHHNVQDFCGIRRSLCPHGGRQRQYDSETAKKLHAPTPFPEINVELQRRALPTAAIAMALVAIHAVVHVTIDVAMIAIRIRLRVAVGALEDAVVSRICVARRADAVRVAVIHREPRVIESGSQPS